MAYESPITLMTEKIANDLANKTEELIMECVQRVGVSVDKDELVRAMNYDRGQYEKGYKDGMSDAVKHGKWIDHIRDYWCSECGGRIQEEQVKRFSICPYCFARMDGEE